MNRKILSSVFLVALSAILVLFVSMRLHQPEILERRIPEPDELLPADAEIPPLPAEEPPEATPAPPYAESQSFTLSFIGDCTLASHQYLSTESPYHYASRMNGDYAYPFSNTVRYFSEDDFTLANLECTFSDRKLSSLEQFYFIAPAEWANILTEGCVDFVTTANNHMGDFGEQGEEDTYAALEAVGLPYGTNGQAQLVTTDSGLKIGIYCAYKRALTTEKATAAVAELKEQGAELIICAFHWGTELHYTPDEEHVEIAHACIDAGADIIYGSHPHALQPIEKYEDGLIMYSMGNWSFGGNTHPTDPDTGIVQVTLTRDPYGSISIDGFDIIPCGVSSLPRTGENDNDYRPTPYAEGTEEYDRALSKLLGTYEGGNLTANYSGWYSSYT